MKVKWDDSVCTHSGNCVKGLPRVFAIEGGQFVIRESAASEEEVRQQVAKCPSGALTIEA